MIPLAFVKISEYFAKDDKFFKTDVNTPATSIITPCPSENKNNINAAQAMFVVIVAVAMIPARIGVEQGVVANANTAPKIIGQKNAFVLLLCGNFLTKIGKLISISPTKFNPKIKINDDKNSIKYERSPAPNTCPVRAAIIPIVVKHIAKPKIKDVICRIVFEVFCSGVDPMQLTTTGNIPIPQGDNDDTTPPRKHKASIKNENSPFTFV